MITNEYTTEYYILAGTRGLKQKLEEAKIEVSPYHLMIVQIDSKLGKSILKEVKKKLKQLGDSNTNKHYNTKKHK